MTNNLKLKSLQLNNIGNFVSETIDFDNNLTTLIGKNGTGKTLILKAIALALLGDSDQRYRDMLGLSGTKGSISITYTINDITFKNSVFIDLEGVRVEGDTMKVWSKEIGCLDHLLFSFNQPAYRETLAYSSRGCSPEVRDFTPILKSSSISEIDYLITWVRDLKSMYSADQISNIVLELFKLINEVMPLDSGEKLIELIDLELNAPHVRVYGNPMSITSLSTGLRHTIGAISYIFSRLFDVYPNVELNELRNQSAVVLFDTLDSLLHPSLQKHLYYNFKNVCPNIQFIASTHSPLAIAGLNREQIYILESKSDAK